MIHSAIVRIVDFCAHNRWTIVIAGALLMLEAAAFEPNVEGRFMIDVCHRQHPWIVIVESDADARLLVVVTVHEVSE